MVPPLQLYYLNCLWKLFWELKLHAVLTTRYWQQLITSLREFCVHPCQNDSWKNCKSRNWFNMSSDTMSLTDVKNRLSRSFLERELDSLERQRNSDLRSNKNDMKKFKNKYSKLDMLIDSKVNYVSSAVEIITICAAFWKIITHSACWLLDICIQSYDISLEIK